MKRNRGLTSIKKAVLSLGGTPPLRALEKAGRDLAGSQRRVLSTILSANAGTEFGRRHGFSSLGSYEDYRQAVPLHSYEALRPYIDKMCAGAPDILFPGRPMLYNTTSGTTDKPKLIPVNPREFDTAINSEYKSKRLTHRLQRPEIQPLPRNSYDLLKTALVSMGLVKEGQYKVSCLRREPLHIRLFEEMAARVPN